MTVSPRARASLYFIFSLLFLIPAILIDFSSEPPDAYAYSLFFAIAALPLGLAGFRKWPRAVPPSTESYFHRIKTTARVVAPFPAPFPRENLPQYLAVTLSLRVHQRQADKSKLTFAEDLIISEIRRVAATYTGQYIDPASGTIFYGAQGLHPLIEIRANEVLAAHRLFTDPLVVITDFDLVPYKLDDDTAGGVPLGEEV